LAAGWVGVALGTRASFASFGIAMIIVAGLLPFVGASRKRKIPRME
jgi:hypothetical protein